MLELLGVVSMLNALPPLFHQLAHSNLLKALAPGATVVSLGHTEFIPAVAIIPFMVYQLAGFGTLHYVVPKAVNWVINVAILVLIVGGYMANREGTNAELTMGVTWCCRWSSPLFHGVSLRRMHPTTCTPTEGRAPLRGRLTAWPRSKLTGAPGSGALPSVTPVCQSGACFGMKSQATAPSASGQRHQHAGGPGPIVALATMISSSRQCLGK